MTIRRNNGRRSGFAVLVLLILLALMTIYVMSNAASLHQLNQHLKLIEREHTMRLAAEAPKSLPIIPTTP